MNGKRVLIIDDDARNIFALSATLRARGYNCISAPGAEQGISLLKDTGDIGIVLLDMMMPDMDGYEALPLIKEIRPSVAAIAVTAQAMVGDREKCIEAGAADYLSKPIDVDKLISILKTHLK